MSFISYAQNFEDVMLWRALKHVENGFYIDVGANDPTLYSVTRAFYDAGWSGINLEPVAEFFNRLQAQRPRDKNLRIGAGSKAGSFPFYDIPDSGLATSDSTVAERHRQNGWNVVTIDVPLLPLTQICQEHVTGDIHFLKIDVEGAEKEVLSGMDFQRWRPWILVVEATVPMSQNTVHQTWEPLVTDAGYEFAYFDGLNRYYVAQEHAELKSAFAVPPNVFDGFVLNADQESRLRATEAEVRAEQSRARALAAELQRAEAESKQVQAESKQVQAESKQVQAESKQVQAELKLIETETALRDAEAREKNVAWRLETMTASALQTEQQLAAVYASSSWRMTRPMRAFKRVLQHPPAAIGMVRNGAHHGKVAAKTTFLRVARFLVAQPQVRKAAVRTLARYPSLDAKMRKLAFRIQSGAGHAGTDNGNPYQHTADPGQHALPQSARKVLAALQRSADKNLS